MSYVLSVRAAHPGRFALVKPVDPANPAVAETVADWAATKGTVGIRLFLVPAISADPADPGLNRVLAAAAQHSIPVNMACPGRLEQVGQLAAQPQHKTGDRPSRTDPAVRAAGPGRRVG
jgi:predicted TIM-barrel fold metal-dependent hydrolase